MKSKNETKKGSAKIIFRMLALTAIIVFLVILFGPSPETFIKTQ